MKVVFFPLFISGAEIFFIIFIVIMIFGADKVPEIAKGLGKGMRQIKDATNEMKHEITNSAQKQGVDLKSMEDFSKDITKNISHEIKEIKDEVEEGFGSIKRKL